MSGTAVYVLGRIVARFLVEPIQEMRRTIAAVALAEHSDVYSNPGLHNGGAQGNQLAERYPGTRHHFPQLMARLEAATYQIPWYPGLAEKIGFPSQERVDDAVRGLTGIQNSRWSEDACLENVKRAKKIRDALRIRAYTYPSDKIEAD